MNRTTPTIIGRVVTRGAMIAVAAALLGGCMSVPALSGPAPQSLGTRQKTIAQLLTQWADLTNAAIAATGDTEGWKDDVPLAPSKTWDPAAEKVRLAPCHTRGSNDASQLQAVVFHAAFELDPHPIAEKLTAYWESQGFTVTRTVDWTSPSGRTDIVIRATRPDGVYYGLTATRDLVSINVMTECSTHPSIDEWVQEGLQKRFDELDATPTPTPTPQAPLGQSAGDATPNATSVTVTDSSDLFREFHEDASPDATAATRANADEDGWVWA